MTGTINLRRLALEEARFEFPDHIPSNWEDLKADDLMIALNRLSLKLLFEPEVGKRKALANLLKAISEAENEDPKWQVFSDEFLENHGIDNDQFWDENPNLAPGEKLFQAIVGRKQRPRFYFEVEELIIHLEESRANQFRRAV